MALHHLLVSLRNAYDAHDRPLFEDLLLRVNAKMIQAAPPASQLAPCIRGGMCVCTTFEMRTSCAYIPRSPS